jgi:hypothetical protein
MGQWREDVQDTVNKQRRSDTKCLRTSVRVVHALMGDKRAWRVREVMCSQICGHCDYHTIMARMVECRDDCIASMGSCHGVCVAQAREEKRVTNANTLNTVR